MVNRPNFSSDLSFTGRGAAMKVFARGLLSVVVFAYAPIMAKADPMPRGAQPASPSKVAQAYSGKTDLWETDCGGGIYFGPNGQARAWCSQNSDNLGAGTWYVQSDGQLCQELTWYWPNGQNAGASAGDRACISHVVDRRGKLWRSWPESSEWWPIDATSGLVRGYKFQNNVRHTRQKLNL